MAERLKAELKQNAPFASLAEEAILNLERTADCFRRSLQQVLKLHGITATQYNALRILRGASPEGLPCSELGQRLVSSDPDITRLLGRLIREGYAQRSRATSDRRIVLTRITPAGRALLHQLIPIIDQQVEESLAHMPAEKLNTLIDLLEEARLVPDAESGGMPHRVADDAA